MIVGQLALILPYVSSSFGISYAWTTDLPLIGPRIDPNVKGRTMLKYLNDHNSVLDSDRMHKQTTGFGFCTATSPVSGTVDVAVDDA
jgi:hypothetical protein